MIIAVMNMEMWKLLDTLFFSEDLQLQKLDKGLTNTNYLLQLDNTPCVLRVPRADSEQIVDRQQEALALQAIEGKGFDVDTLYFDAHSGYKLTRYLDDAKTYGECTRSDKLEAVAQLMRRFHELDAHIHTSFHPLEKLRQYRRHVSHPFYDLSGSDWLLSTFEQMPKQSCLCHNDWVDGNILFTKQRVYLIDYEYAADNDPLFDVVSFLSENQIYDQTQRERFYQAYFSHIDDKLRQRLALWEGFADRLWCTWAMMMWESRQEDIYKTIAKEKYEALQRLLACPLLKKYQK